MEQQIFHEVAIDYIYSHLYDGEERNSSSSCSPRCQHFYYHLIICVRGDMLAVRNVSQSFPVLLSTVTTQMSMVLVPSLIIEKFL